MGTQRSLPPPITAAIADQQIDMTQVNVILPTQSFGALISEFEKITMEIVQIDPDPKAGEVYEPNGKGKGKALSKAPLLRIANAIGLVWVPSETTILESSPRKARAKATALFRKANGEWVTMVEEKTIDIDALEEKQRITKEEEADYGKIELDKNGRWVMNGNRPNKVPWTSEEEKQKYIDREVRRSLVQYRLYKDENASTGAKERVIRAVLAIKNTYTDAELAKPLAFPRIVADVSAMMQDPATRNAAIGMMTGKVADVFGEQPEAPPKDVGPALTATVMEEEKAEEPDPFAQPPGPEVQTASEPEGPDDKEQLRDALVKLEEWSHDDILQRNPAVRKVIDEALLGKNATLEAVKAMIDRCEKYVAEYAK